MHTLLTARTYRHTALQLTTRRPTEFVDLTDGLVRFIGESGLQVGTLTVQTTHTTTAIVVNEHEPLLLGDFERFLEQLAPRRAAYAHDDMSKRVGVTSAEPPNGHAHCRALTLSAFAVLNIVGGRLALGRWQRVFLVELDGPRERTVTVVAHGEPAL